MSDTTKNQVENKAEKAKSSKTLRIFIALFHKVANPLKSAADYTALNRQLDNALTALQALDKK